MIIRDLKPGQFCTRPNWGHHTSAGLCIHREPLTESLTYIDHGKYSSHVRPGSTAYHHTNFELCDSHGNLLTTITEESTMKYDDIKVIVTSNKFNTVTYPTEVEALECIADQLEKEPRAKFTMFKPYQTVEPKSVNLTELIKKIAD